MAGGHREDFTSALNIDIVYKIGSLTELPP
jgi:hypothetical protein